MKHKKPNWTKFETGKPAMDQFGGHIVLNSRYQVHIRPACIEPPFGEVVELSIKRRDKEPIYDWRDLQRIKHDLFGPNCTGIQIFPPESHLVDTANQYFMYVFLNYELPFGFKNRVICGQVNVAGPLGNSKQRPFDEPHHVPADLAEQEAWFLAVLENKPQPDQTWAAANKLRGMLIDRTISENPAGALSPAEKILLDALTSYADEHLKPFKQDEMETLEALENKLTAPSERS